MIHNEIARFRFAIMLRNTANLVTNLMLAGNFQKMTKKRNTHFLIIHVDSHGHLKNIIGDHASEFRAGWGGHFEKVSKNQHFKIKD